MYLRTIPSSVKALTGPSRLFLTNPIFLKQQHRLFHSGLTQQAIKSFLLADIGEGITECEVIQWFVEPGSTVQEFEKICEVQSDKASVEISSRFTGKVLKMHYGLNDIAKVGSALVDIETEDDENTEPEQQSQNEDPTTPQQEATTPKQFNIVNDVKPASDINGSAVALAAPAIRRLAKEKGINISDVTGTGKDGRVLKEDLTLFEKTGTVKEETKITNPHMGPGSIGGDRSEPLNMIQKAMFKSMTQSLSIPQLGFKDDIEIDNTTEYRSALNKHIAEHPNLHPYSKMSYLPIFIKCLSIALSHYPIMNAKLIGDLNDVNSVKILHRASHNIGIAMDTPQGLIVPNIKDVQNKTIFDIASEIHRLSELGKKGQIPMSDLKGGTITISNIGTIGGTYANPVIISSELAIVALGKMQRLPRFDSQDNVVAKHIMPVSWSADHRVIDGATIARFGNHWKNLIENPALLASELR